MQHLVVCISKLLIYVAARISNAFDRVSCRSFKFIGKQFSRQYSTVQVRESESASD